MSASQFIQMLESKGLLDPESIKELQRMVEQSKVRVTPEALARILVENGQLTRFQATKLVTELKEQADPSLGGKSTPASKSSNSSASVDDLLPPDEPEVEEIVEVIEDPVAEVVEVVEAVESGPTKSSKRRSKSSGSAEGSNEAGAFADVAMAKPVKASTLPEKKSLGILRYHRGRLLGPSAPYPLCPTLHLVLQRLGKRSLGDRGNQLRQSRLRSSYQSL